MNIFLQKLMLKEVTNLIGGIDYDTLFSRVVKRSPSLHEFNCDNLGSEEEKKSALLKFLFQQPDEAYPALVSSLRALACDKTFKSPKKSERILPNQDFGMSMKRAYRCAADPSLYHMNKEPRGLAIIFNMGVFMSNHPMRNGSNKDVENLVKTFSEGLQMKVKVFEDLTRDGVKRKIEMLTEDEKLSNYDLFTLFFMSHGHSDPMNDRSVNFITYDGALVNSEWIVNQFSEKSCPQLSGKPKLFFFQSCRTPHEKSACWIPPYSLVPLISQFQKEEQFPLLSICRDMFLVHSTSVGHYSFRDSHKGSHFIQALCETLKNDSNHMDLFSLMDEVNKKLQSDERNSPIVIESRGINQRIYIKPFKSKTAAIKKTHSPVQDFDWSSDSSPEFLVT